MTTKEQVVDQMWQRRGESARLLRPLAYYESAKYIEHGTISLAAHIDQIVTTETPFNNNTVVATNIALHFTSLEPDRMGWKNEHGELNVIEVSFYEKQQVWNPGEKDLVALVQKIRPGEDLFLSIDYVGSPQNAQYELSGVTRLQDAR